MALLEVRNKSRGTILGRAVRVADSFLSRLLGVSRSSGLDPGEGLLISPCRAVHTIGQKRTMDVVFIDRRGRVVALHPRLRPMRLTRWIRAAEYVLELPEGTIAETDTEVADQLAWVPAPASENHDAVPGQRTHGSGRPPGLQPRSGILTPPRRSAP